MAELYGEDWSLLPAEGDEPEVEEELQDDDAQELEGQSAAGPLSVSPEPDVDRPSSKVRRTKWPENRSPGLATAMWDRALHARTPNRLYRQPIRQA